MIGHDEARTLASARADGELGAPEAGRLDEHLGACGECRAFAGGLGRLSALTSSLPRERAPAALPARVDHAIAATALARPPRRRRVWLTAPAIAAAVIAAVVVVVVQPVPRVSLRQAGAAEALARIGSFYVERQIEELDPSGGVERTTLEKIWYRAPGVLRIERSTRAAGRSGSADETIVRRPGVEYVRRGAVAYVRRNVPPTADIVPEPLSPTLAFYGTDRGAGPTVAGRPTRRIVFETDAETRVALVDAARYAVLENAESFVLGKEAFVLEKQALRGKRLRTRKTTLALRYDLALGDDLFAIPGDAPPIDAGFRARPLADLALPPRAEPAGFRRLQAGTGPEGDAILYVRGAMPILIETTRTTAPPPVDRLERSERLSPGGREATLVVGIYTVPRVVFFERGLRVTVSAPLPRAALVALAEAMYPPA